MYGTVRLCLENSEVRGLENPPLISQGVEGGLSSRIHLKDVQEKLLKVDAFVTVLKLTQVGETSSLRRSGERWLRNSAKWPRKFAIRGASGGSRFWRPQKIGFCDCLSKTQDSANSQEDV